MRRLLLAATALAAVCSSTPAVAQSEPEDGWSLSGTTRVRYEAIKGQTRAGFNDRDELVNLRTTLLAQYRDGPFRVAAELWDSRVYNANARTPLTTGEVNAFELVQAFGEFRMPGALGRGTSATIQAGRFLLDLGSRRLVANDDYRNTTNGFTGVRADLTFPRGWKAILVYTLPQQRRPDDLPALRRNAVRWDHEGFDLVLWGGLVSRANAIGNATVEGQFFHLGRTRRAWPTHARPLTQHRKPPADPCPGSASSRLRDRRDCSTRPHLG